MPTLSDAASHLKESPHTYGLDLHAVSTFIEQLTEPFEENNSDVYIERAVLELTNASGYPVGHLIWDGDEQSFVFTAAGATFEQVS